MLLYWVPWILGMSRPGHSLTRADLPMPDWLRKWLRIDVANVRLLDAELSASMEQVNEDSIKARVNKCLQTLASEPSSLDTAQQAHLMVLHRIYVEISVSQLRPF